MTGLNHLFERREVSLSSRGSDSSELGQFTFRDSEEVDMVFENEDFFPEIKPITDLKKDYKLLGRYKPSHTTFQIIPTCPISSGLAVVDSHLCTWLRLFSLFTFCPRLAL